MDDFKSRKKNLGRNAFGQTPGILFLTIFQFAASHVLHETNLTPSICPNDSNFHAMAVDVGQINDMASLEIRPD